MSRYLRSSVKRQRTQQQQALQSIKKLMPVLSTNQHHTHDKLRQCEFLAILQLMPVNYTDVDIDTAAQHRSRSDDDICKRSKSCSQCHGQMEQYLLQKNVDIGHCIRMERTKYVAASEARDTMQRRICGLLAEKDQCEARYQARVQENLRLKMSIQCLEYVSKILCTK